MGIKRKRTKVGTFAPRTHEKTFSLLLSESEENILYDDGDELKVTPKAVRDKGIIVCSECGCYNSDSLSNCKYCHEQLIYVKPK